MADPFNDGFFDTPGSRNLPRTPSDQIQYETGRRLRGPRRVRAVTPQDVAEAKGWLAWSLRLAAVGAIAGCGYGIWQAVSAGFGVQAVHVLKWTGIGAAAGALLPVGLVVAVGFGLIAAAIWALGMLLNFLTSL